MTLMLRAAVGTAGFFALSTGAMAGCLLYVGTSPCSEDSSGNRYITEQNFGGGYNTYRNGSLYSQTEQTLSGGYRESFSSGGYRNYDYNPYERVYKGGGLYRYGVPSNGEE